MSMTLIAERPTAGFLQLYQKDDDALRTELSEGLLAPQAATSPKFLYDALGSKLFEAICELPEYYPTRTEAAIFDTHLSDIVESAGQGGVLIDLGAGNCAKAARLFPVLRPRDYVPVDISVDFLRGAVEGLRQRFPRIRMTGLGMDFSRSLALPAFVPEDGRLFFYPGSSIGNFAPEQALSLLTAMRTACGDDGGLLIGVDLAKDARLLNAAYDDALGVTASFNLNLLRHLNGLLGADFDVRDWRHRAFWNPAQGRVEMHLEARRHVVVRWQGGQRHFREGERIHTENSYKYTRQGFLQLLERAGFPAARTWTDEREWFLVCHARAARG
nr:L-histidine N(alpha)-methyltransferase [Noviherbaspirillum aridicola]